MTRNAQLEQALLTLLAQEIGPGQPLPVERVLSARLGIARMTLRPLLEHCESRGVIIKSGGRRLLAPARRRPANVPAQVLMVTLLDAFLTPQPTSNLVQDEGGAQEVSVAEIVRSHLYQAGMRSLPMNPRHIEPEMILRLLRSPPQVVMISPEVSLYPQLMLLNSACRLHGIPMVVMAEPGVFAGASSIRHDHAAGAAALTQWLLAHGHRHIQQLWCYEETPSWLRERELGHQRTMLNAGLVIRPPICTGELFLATRHPETGLCDRETFDRSVRGIAGWLPESLCTATPVTAIMVSHDTRVPATNAALRLFGRVPGRDVLVTGYDYLWRDEPSRIFEPTPPAVTIDKNNQTIAQAIAQEVLQRLAGEPARDTLVSGTVMVDSAV